MWRQGLYRGRHARMRSLGWVLIRTTVSGQKRDTGHGDRGQEVHVEIQGDDRHLQAPESGLEHIRPSRPLEGTSPVDIRIPSFWTQSFETAGLCC